MISVSKSTEIKAPAAAVWKTVGDFGSAQRYLAVVEHCDLHGEGAGLERSLRLKDGSVVRERLMLHNDGDQSLRYAIVEGPLPVADYVSTMRVDSVGAGQCRVTWSSTFEPRGASEADARTTIEGIYQMGLDGLQKLHGA